MGRRWSYWSQNNRRIHLSRQRNYWTTRIVTSSSSFSSSHRLSVFFSLVSLERMPTNLDVPKAKFLTQSVLLAKNQKMYPNVDVGMIVAKNQVAPELVMQIVLALSNSYLIMMMFKNIV